MISIVMPYWNRAEALRNALGCFSRLYADKDLQVVVVDDGSAREPARDVRLLVDHLVPSMTWLSLPHHDEPRCPAEAINRGIAAASGDIICLTNPETEHPTDVLTPIEAALADDPRAYVICACWDPDRKMWYEHSEHRPGKMHWFTAARREVWQAAGPIDQQLMAGHCYDDNDLRNRMHRVASTFLTRDDLVVHHRTQLQKDSKRGTWDAAGLVAVNRRRYREVWGNYWEINGPSVGSSGE